MDGIRFTPLTVDQKRRLDADGNRIWTEQETRAMRSNLVMHDHLRTVFLRRCGVKECLFVIGGLKQTYALPSFSDVCDVCYYMHYALRNAHLKDTNYFVNLHEQWKKDVYDPKRRERLGL